MFGSDNQPPAIIKNGVRIPLNIIDSMDNSLIDYFELADATMDPIATGFLAEVS